MGDKFFRIGAAMTIMSALISTSCLRSRDYNSQSEGKTLGSFASSKIDLPDTQALVPLTEIAFLNQEWEKTSSGALLEIGPGFFPICRNIRCQYIEYDDSLGESNVTYTEAYRDIGLRTPEYFSAFDLGRQRPNRYETVISVNFPWFNSGGAKNIEPAASSYQKAIRPYGKLFAFVEESRSSSQHDYKQFRVTGVDILKVFAPHVTILQQKGFRINRWLHVVDPTPQSTNRSVISIPIVGFEAERLPDGYERRR